MDCISGACTSETVDCPLLELLEGYVCCGRRRVEVESVRVLLLFVTAVDELLLAVVDVPPFCVYPVVVLSEHGDCRVEGKKTMSTISQFWSSSRLSGGELAACGDPLVWETRLDALCPKVSIKARPVKPIGNKLIASYLPTKQLTSTLVARGCQGAQTRPLPK